MRQAANSKLQVASSQNMKQFIAFVKKEFYHVFRDRKTLLLLFGMPVVQIVLFGFALTNEIKNSKIGRASCRGTV